jgi:hypothetical protein
MAARCAPQARQANWCRALIEFVTFDDIAVDRLDNASSSSGAPREWIGPGWPLARRLQGRGQPCPLQAAGDDDEVMDSCADCRVLLRLLARVSSL